MGCKKCAEGICGCSTMNAEKVATVGYFVIDNSWSAHPGHGGSFKEFQGSALKAIDRTRGLEKFIIIPMNGSTQKEAFDKKTAKEIVKNMKPSGGTKSLAELLPAYQSGYYTDNDTYIFTDAPHHRLYAAEEPAVQEPDWIPAGDGRAIGQQNFGINLSPLHAEDDEGRHICDECGKVADYNVQDVEYRWNLDEGQFTGKGESRHHIGDINDFYCEDCYNKSDTPYRAESFNADEPSPTFNEDITGQDGPSADPTNQTFEAMRTMAPSSRDVESARRSLKNSGYGDVIYDRYIVNQQGSSNKFYYTAITEKDGKYYPMGAYGRIGYLGTLFNVAGKKERPKMHFGSMELAYRQIKEKEDSKINARKSEKRYVDYTLTRDAESLSEIEGPTAEATSGGLHSPSSFDITWEDGSGQSSASLPPNEIAWAEDVKQSEGFILGSVGAIGLLAIGLVAAIKFGGGGKKKESTPTNKKAEKGCCGGSKIVRKNSEFSVGQINPVEVEGQSDIYGAEELHSPQTSAKVSQPNWGPQTTYLQNQRSTQKMW